MFRKYDKVVRFEKPDCEGILNGDVYIFEKIDGSNVSVWKDRETGKLCAASRNNVVMDSENVIYPFNGFCAYLLEPEMKARLDGYFLTFPYDILYGEWLIHHTVHYPEDKYKQMYIFDVYGTIQNIYYSHDACYPLLKRYGFRVAPLLAKLSCPTIDEVMQYVGQTKMGGEQGEGIVLKNYDFINKYGRTVYGKIVSKKFQETKHVPKTVKNDEIEKSIASVYVTETRVAKIIHKVELYINHGELIKIQDIPKVLQLMYNDIITEDMWEIIKKKNNPTINFKTLRSCIEAETKKYFFAYLNNQTPYK